ncbi:MAG: Lrp/AsnC family transcriptional regulator [Rhodospirillales bacterium]|jgi:DNA-binding Lrp family transcriptional regulator|nr:Lrp/AsnC family transcriptional regulator [Rhodospirillales bacterium]
MDEFDRRLLSDFQRSFPLVPQPFAELARRLDCCEDEVIEAYGRLKDEGAISRIGAVVRVNAAGASTLAAIAVPQSRLDEVAALVSAYPEVNHNYEREHGLNLWFVVTAPDRARVDAVLADIGIRTGLEVLDLPMRAEYHIDLGFDLP